jgi:hypothetical protein
MFETLLTLGVPILAGLVLTLLRAIASQKRLSLETSRDVALDMTFLALGAAGSVFHNQKLQTRMGSDAVAMLALLIVVDLFVAAVLLYLQRFTISVTRVQLLANVMLGGLPVTLVAVVIYLSR